MYTSTYTYLICILSTVTKDRDIFSGSPLCILRSPRLEFATWAKDARGAAAEIAGDPPKRKRQSSPFRGSPMEPHGAPLISTWMLN